MITVLSIDDNQTLQLQLRRTLEPEGFKCVCIQTWADLPAAIRNHSPELLLLDLNMPVISGTTITQMVRRHWRDLPIVVLSAEDESVVAANAREAGARAFILKKNLTRDLVPRIREVLAIMRAEADAAEAPDEAESA